MVWPRVRFRCIGPIKGTHAIIFTTFLCQKLGTYSVKITEFSFKEEWGVCSSDQLGTWSEWNDIGCDNRCFKELFKMSYDSQAMNLYLITFILNFANELQDRICLVRPCLGEQTQNIERFLENGL